MQTTIFFRGRHTSEVMRDAEEAGIPVERVVIVCRDDDALEEPGDVPVSAFDGNALFDHDAARVALVANGGTTAQLVPVLRRCERAFHAWRTAALWREGPSFRVFDVQRDRTVEL